VVARGMGKCCVAGCADLEVEKDLFRANGKTVREGDWISLDGSLGEVISGKVETVQPTFSGEFETLMKWADKFRKLKVRTNADTPHDTQVAREFGAEGIGLCRTEHMFFDPVRIEAVREMILADTTELRERALAKLLPMQKGDFREILREMKGFPVTIRLLDPPLHEFLPKTDREIEALARMMGLTATRLRAKVETLGELNPMLGHRGCRLGITYPEIYRMQVRAIIEAASELTLEGVKVFPEIMIPLVGHVNELIRMRRDAEEICQKILKDKRIQIDYRIGTMIELPRAAVTADQIAKDADFFSFGTNDLTQTTFGISRDDAAHFLPFYLREGIYPADPFVSIDRDGVGQLIRIAVEKGRKVRPEIKIGICGEHGGDPSSVEYSHELGFSYVSCSPYRVPIARLAAAHAVLKGC
ncbi:MAG: pyruvate, phosphate dikinase, partial [Deltaproteobacteria bacterium]|nr:pyruvate, phosphate dikinase [Deltaproteobacteria bacterium]